MSAEQPQRDWTLQSLFDDLELALYGKTGNTWEAYQADRVYVFLAKLKVEFNAERIAKEAAEKRGRDTKPCSHCQWPKPMNDDYHICPCCGFEPGYDDSMIGPYQWDGTWWAKDERKPELVRRLEARCEALQAQLAVPPAVDRWHVEGDTAYALQPVLGGSWRNGVQQQENKFYFAVQGKAPIAERIALVQAIVGWLQRGEATQPPGDPPAGDRR